MKIFIIRKQFKFSDVPSPPVGPLNITNVTYNSADLEWKPSENDGGTPITGYLVEYRTATRSTWSKAATVDAKQTTYTVGNLMEGTEYYFRIIAVNAEGHSRPLESSDIIRPMRELGKFFPNILIFVHSLNKVFLKVKSNL